MATMPHLTVLMPQSGTREGGYIGDQAEEQIALLEAMQADPDALRLRILEGATEPKPFSTLRYWKRRLYAACGIDPRARSSFRRKRRPGSLIEELRLRRGLAPMPTREPGVEDLLELYRSRIEQKSPRPTE